MVGVEVQGRRRSTSQAMVVWEFPPINAQGWACVWMNWVSPRMTHIHMHTHWQRLCLHVQTQTEVFFVLTGWWSGAPVCGLHPEGESQVLLGCRGARQSTVLPRAHIWGKGRQHWLYCCTVLFSQIWTGSTTMHVISVRCFYIFMFTHLCVLRCK